MFYEEEKYRCYSGKFFTAFTLYLAPILTEKLKRIKAKKSEDRYSKAIDAMSFCEEGIMALEAFFTSLARDTGEDYEGMYEDLTHENKDFAESSFIDWLEGVPSFIELNPVIKSDKKARDIRYSVFIKAAMVPFVKDEKIRQTFLEYAQKLLK